MAKFALGVSSELARMSEEEIKKMLAGEKIAGYSQMNADDLIRMRLINTLLDRGAVVISSDANAWYFMLKEQAFTPTGEPIPGLFNERKVRIPRADALHGAKAEVGRALRTRRGSGLGKIRVGSAEGKVDMLRMAEDIVEVLQPQFTPDKIPPGLIKEEGKWKQVPITPAEQAECMQILAFGQSNGIGIERTLRFYGNDPTFGGTTEGLIPGVKCNKNTRDSFAAALKLVKFPRDVLQVGAILPSSDIALALLANDQRLTRELVMGNMRFACIRKTPLPTLDTSYYDLDMAQQLVIVPDRVITGDLSDITWEDGQQKPSGQLPKASVAELMGEETYAKAMKGEGSGVHNRQNTETPGAAYEMPRELLLHKARMMAKAGILAPTEQWLQWGSLSEAEGNIKVAREKHAEAEGALAEAEEGLQTAIDTKERLPSDSKAVPVADTLIERFETEVEEATVQMNEATADTDKWEGAMVGLTKMKMTEAYQQWVDLTDYITNLRKVWPSEIVVTGKEKEPLQVKGLFGQFQAVYDVTSVSPEQVRGLPKEGIFDFDRLCGSSLADNLKLGKEAIKELTIEIDSKVEGTTLQDAVIDVIGAEIEEDVEPEIEGEDELLKAMRAVIMPAAPPDSLIDNPVGCLAAITAYLARRPMVGLMMGLESRPDFLTVEVPDEEKKRLGDPERALSLMVSLLDTQCGAGMSAWMKEADDDAERGGKTAIGQEQSRPRPFNAKLEASDR